MLDCGDVLSMTSELVLCRLVVQSCSDAAAETSSGSVPSDDVSRLEVELDSIEQVISFCSHLTHSRLHADLYFACLVVMHGLNVCCQCSVAACLSFVLDGINVLKLGLFIDLLVYFTYSAVSFVKRAEACCENITAWQCFLCVHNTLWIKKT